MVVLLDDDDHAAIKRIDERDGHVFLVSSNPEYADIPVANPEAMTTRGRVIGTLKTE